MEDELIALLESIEKDMTVIRQGSLDKDKAYPDTFLTFWNREEEGAAYYDNEVASSRHLFDVNVYSTNPDTAYSLLREARLVLKANGWVCVSFGYDIASDEHTHIGRGMQVEFLKFEKKEETSNG
jgi:hypothetical protein